MLDITTTTATAATAMTTADLLLSMGAALLIGAFIAGIYVYKTRHTRSFVITLALLPAIVAMVIMLVNGNIGAGVAVAGAFSLVRFRSVPGTAEEIGAIFLAMTAGLGCGMGCVLYSVAFVVVLGLIMLIYKLAAASRDSKGTAPRTLRITVPEDLNYNQAFEEVLDGYTSVHDLIGVKTTNMGSLYKLTYDVQMKSGADEKSMIDELRCRNGNLEISLAIKEVDANVL